MTAQERRATLILALMLLARMLGLFMVLPVLSPWALELAGSQGLAVGLAVGVYGLTQALLQIPLGWLSDHIGRRPVIWGGLSLFVVGSATAAIATNIEMLIFGRLLQGGGAIAATSTALLADLLREQVRSVGLAIVGVSIGMAFLLALLFGPVIMLWTDVPGLFWIAAGMGVLAMILLGFLHEPQMHRASASDGGLPAGVLALVLSVFVLHAVLASVFVVVPLQLQEQSAMATQMQWRVWLPIVAVSIVVVFPLLRVVEARGLQWRALPWAFGLMTVSILLLGWVPTIGFAMVLCAYFGAFNFLEASLPSMLSRLVGPQRRGRVMGVFSTAQFLGMFAGASTAGWVLAHFSFTAVAELCALVALIPTVVLTRLALRQSSEVTRVQLVNDEG